MFYEQALKRLLFLFWGLHSGSRCLSAYHLGEEIVMGGNNIFPEQVICTAKHTKNAKKISVQLPVTSDQSGVTLSSKPLHGAMHDARRRDLLPPKQCEALQGVRGSWLPRGGRCGGTAPAEGVDAYRPFRPIAAQGARPPQKCLIK